jgi:hypothetical protein
MTLFCGGCDAMNASCPAQACQSSLNNAGLSLVLQSFATGLLLTAHLANAEYSESLGDTIQVRSNHPYLFSRWQQLSLP